MLFFDYFALAFPQDFNLLGIVIMNHLFKKKIIIYAIWINLIFYEYLSINALIYASKVWRINRKVAKWVKKIWPIKLIKS